MASIFSRKLRKGRRPRNRPDGKLDQIVDAGIRLLARKDFEAISMAQLAREAGCSVGAVYARFSDKNAFLYRLLSAAFRSLEASAARELDTNRWKHLSAAGRVERIVDHMVSKMTSLRAAGVIRATMKLATVRPLARERFEEYRKALSDHAVAILASKLPKTTSPQGVRVAMQIVLATVTDAVLQKQPGPMVAGSNRMKAALTNIMLGYLGISKTQGWAGKEADGEDKAQEIQWQDDAAPGEGVFDPDLRAMRVSKPAQAVKPAKASRRSAPIKPKVKVRTPPNVPERPEPEAPPRPRRRHRLI